MRLITAVLLLCFLLPASAGAADVFVKKKNDRLEGLPPVTRPVFDNYEHAKPKPEPSQEIPAETQTAPALPESKELANTYYKNCVSKQQEGLSPQSQKDLCACTAGKMTTEMTPEELKAMVTDTPEGAKQRDRMTVLVYMPCMRYPARDLVFNQCVGNMEIRRGLKKYAEVCNCLASNMGEYVELQGSGIASQALMNRTEDTPLDPGAILNTFMESEAFSNKSQEHVAACARKHEFGIGQ